MHAGRAVERVDFEAGVVGEEIAGGVRAVVPGFEDRVFFKRRAGFFGGWDAGERSNVEVGRDQAELAELAGVGGGAKNDRRQDRLPYVSKDFWIATSSATPWRARAISAASCSSSNGVFSAVDWIST